MSDSFIDIAWLAIRLWCEMLFFVIPMLVILLIRKTRLEDKIQLALCLVTKSCFAPWIGLSFLGWYESYPSSYLGYDFLFTVPPFIVFTLIVIWSFKGRLATKFKMEHFLIVSSILLSDLPAVLLLNNKNMNGFFAIGEIFFFLIALPVVTIFIFAIAFLISLLSKRIRAKR